MKTSKTFTAGLGACLILAGSLTGYGEDEAAVEAVAKAVRGYYEAMAARDVKALQGVLDATFLVVEAGREQARVHVVQAGGTARLLPPEGNDDWEKLRITDLKVSLSGTHPSVATVTYRVFHPLPPESLKALEAMLKASPSPLEESQRREFAKRLAEGGGTESECAMLALRDGRWRIVSLSVPK